MCIFQLTGPVSGAASRPVRIILHWSAGLCSWGGKPTKLGQLLPTEDAKPLNALCMVHLNSPYRADTQGCNASQGFLDIWSLDILNARLMVASSFKCQTFSSCLYQITTMRQLKKNLCLSMPYSALLWPWSGYLFAPAAQWFDLHNAWRVPQWYSPHWTGTSPVSSISQLCVVFIFVPTSAAESTMQTQVIPIQVDMLKAAQKPEMSSTEAAERFFQCWTWFLTNTQQAPNSQIKQLAFNAPYRQHLDTSSKRGCFLQPDSTESSSTASRDQPVHLCSTAHWFCTSLRRCSGYSHLWSGYTLPHASATKPCSTFWPEQDCGT